MRILMSMFGWNDVGGGTSYPRQVAVNLTRLGHQVCVFYAAVPDYYPAGPPASHRLIHHQEDGVQLVAVQDRPALFLDNRQPLREVRHAEIVASFEQVFNDFQPDIVHYHNFLGLSEGIAEIAHTAGVPSVFSAHNFWMLCPTLYLSLPNGDLCQGVNESGSNCLQCARYGGDNWTPGLPPAGDYLRRRDLLRNGFIEMIDLGLVNSESVRQLFLSNGYPLERIQVQQLSNPRTDAIWQAVGQDRELEVPTRLRIGFLGQVIPIKGVHTLVQAAQLLSGDFEIQVHGMSSEDYLQELKALDQRGVVDFYGSYDASNQAEILTHIDIGVVTSVCLDHSPLVISEYHSARIPVIGAEIGGVPDYLQPAASQLYPPGDVEALAAILQQLLDDHEQLKSMKANIFKPPGSEEYLKGVLAHYDRLIAASDLPGSKHFSQRIKRFLLGRSQYADQVYSAHGLKPQGQMPSDQDFGLDIHSPEYLKTLPDALLARAHWRISPLADIVAKLREQGHQAELMPLSRPQTASEPNPATDMILPETSLPPVLIPLTAEGSGFYALKPCLEASTPSWAPMLLPWRQSLDQAQDALLEFLAAEGVDLAEAPEMVLLESEDRLNQTQICRQVSLCLLPATVDPELLQLAAECPLTASNAPPERMAIMFKPTEDPTWQPLAEALGYRLYCPANTAEGHNQDLLKAFKAMLTRLSQT